MLNDAKLRGAKPREKAYKLTDSHRLYLEVKPSGGKLWRWNYSYGGIHVRDSLVVVAVNR